MNKYCVYLHRRKDNNEVFYVGSGTADRPYSKSRNKTWKEFVEENGYYVEIVKENLSMKESREMEQALTHDYSDTLITKIKKIAVTRDIDFELVNEYLEYDETSSSFLRWKKDIFSGYHKKIKQATSGAEAGFKNNKGRWVVGIARTTYLAHRIVFLLCNGYLNSDEVIDHIDGNPENNKIENLRSVPHAVNSRNRKLPTNETVGVRKVRLKTGSGKGHNDYYMAYCNDLAGKGLCKKYNIKTYGEEEAFRLACEWRKQKIEELNAQGAGYTDRHGT